MTPWLDARQLKIQADLAAIAGRFTRLSRSGRQFVGLCPFHKERHPSFYVHPEKNLFKCFGCGVGGDVFDFVMLIEDLSFTGAMEWVCDFLFRRSISSGVARESEPRSGERIRAGVGAKPLCPAKRGILYSQNNQKRRARILASLDATNRRLQAIEATNRAARAALSTACEPELADALLLENKS